MSSHDSFLTLIRLGIGHEAEIPESIDWELMMSLAEEHGLTAIVFDGASWLSSHGALCDGRTMDLQLKKKWIGRMILYYEHKYKDYCAALGKLAGFYNSHGFKMMVLKGFSISLDYPVPSHRPTGDIDIWAFGQYHEADVALSRELKIPIDNSHHHHTTFSFDGYLVENHFDWVNVHAHRSSAEMEKLFKKLAMDDSNKVRVEGQTVYLPSPNLHALFLLRHSMSHFASTHMNIRQLLDWGLFAKAHTAEIDWKWLVDILDKFHMKDFFMCLNYICVFDLGFSADIFPAVVLPFDFQIGQYSLPERILDDMLSPEFSEESPKGFFRRNMFRYRRWRANAWKHKLCYNESMWTSFWSGLWAHLMKPSSL